MKKKVFGRKLGRERDTRRALFRSLIRAFVMHGKITTTKAKAKSVQPELEKLVTMTKSKDVPTIRRVYSFLGNDGKTTDLLFGNIASGFINKKSGFTRIVNLPRRLGDNSEMVRLEWTEKIENSSKKDVVSGKKTKKKNLKAVKTEEVKEKTNLRSRVAGLIKKKNK